MSEKTILVVDDNEFDRKLMIGAVERKLSCRTLEAANAEQCLELLGKQRVDLVVMDIVMPGHLGSQALTKIREKYNAIELPVIMATSLSEKSGIVDCLRCGANDYITKPVDFEVAASRISAHLKLAELSREMSHLREIAALNAMILTYNHEINNPLTIALGLIADVGEDNFKNGAQIKSALQLIAEIVKKIQAVSQTKEVEYTRYVGKSMMIKLK